MRSVVRASATTVTVPASASIVDLGVDVVSGSEWASGISSSVRLAAWIAGDPRDGDDVALRGVAGGHASAAAPGDIRTTARARAQRSVGAFALTSTIVRPTGGVQMRERGSLHRAPW